MSYCDCYWDDGEIPEFYQNFTVKRARKEYKCCECSGKIAIGDTYEKVVGKWDGEIDMFRTCKLCTELEQWAKISVPCFCNFKGELLERVREMVSDVSPNVPGFFFEYGRRAIRIRRNGGRL